LGVWVARFIRQIFVSRGSVIQFSHKMQEISSLRHLAQPSEGDYKDDCPIGRRFLIFVHEPWTRCRYRVSYFDHWTRKVLL